MIFKNTTSWLALAGSFAVWAAPAVAQQAPVATDQEAVGQDTPVNDTAATAAAQRRAAITGERVADTGDDMIVVTGTRINRPNMASAAPITSVTMQDIQAQAPVSIEEVLNRLPQIAPDSQQNYQDSDGRQRIKLRSLGFERTLVLIDGKRLGTQNGQDTGIIPTSLLQRIDVLSGGASSVYGSDAVSGVVNFVLRQDFEGLRLDGNYNFYNHNNKDTIVSPVARASSFSSPTGLTNDGGRADLTITAGKKLFDDRLSVSAFFNYRSAEKVNYGDRSSSACQLVQSVKDGPLTCSLSTYSVSGYVSPRSGPNNGTAYVNNPNGTRTFVPYGVGANNAANPFDDYPYQRELKRYTAGGFASFKIAPEAELYGSAIWFEDKSYTPTPARVFSYTAFGSDPYRVNCNNPFLSASQATAICGTAAGTVTTAPLDVRYRFNGLPNVATEYVNSAIRATGGIRGQIGDAWNYDVGGVYSRNKQVINYSPYADPILVNRALNVVSVNGTPTCSVAVSGVDTSCVPFDAFSAGNSNASLLRYLLSGQSDGAERSTGSLYNGLATVTGDLTTYGIKTPWAEQGLAVSLGTEFREDRFTSSANETFRTQNGGTDANLKQHVWESNIEVQAPLVQRQRWMHLLQVNGGYRLSKYSTNPDKFTTWKVEGLFAPVDDVTFRGSFNKAQRAPTVIEIRQATNISYSRQGGSQNDFCAPVPRQIADPVNPGRTITTTAPLASREVCRATGLTDALYGSATLLCPNDQCTVRSGGFTADPENAYTQTYGLVLKPRFLPGLVFSVDRYRIKIENSLGYNDDAYYTDGCLRSNGDPFFCSGIVRAANGTLSAAAASNPTSGFIRAGTTNYYYSIARGWDFQGQYTQGLGGIGRLDFGFNGSLTTFAGSKDSPVQPKRNCSGYFGNGCGQLIPKWSHGLRTTYTTPDSVFNASLNWRYVGSLTSANNSGDPAIGGTPERAQTTFYRIDPQNYFDLSLTFNIARQFAFRIIANNLLGRVPPILANSYNISLSRNNTIPARYDSLGRQLAIGTTITF